MVKAKNNEVSAFIEMIDNGSLPQDSIFYADAINTTAKMIEFLNSRHLDYIMAVKTNLSNRPVVMAMEKYISELTDKTQNTSSHYHEVRTDKEDGRKETSSLYFISSLPFTEENCHQIVFSVRSRWMYEAQHNTIDTVLLQDMQHCCDENHLA